MAEKSHVLKVFHAFIAKYTKHTQKSELVRVKARTNWPGVS